jgi:hypothetical protein
MLIKVQKVLKVATLINNDMSNSITLFQNKNDENEGGEVLEDSSNY